MVAYGKNNYQGRHIDALRQLRQLPISAAGNKAACSRTDPDKDAESQNCYRGPDPYEDLNRIAIKQIQKLNSRYLI